MNEYPTSLPEVRAKNPPPRYWSRGGKYPHRVSRKGERTLQVLEYLQKNLEANKEEWIRPSKIARDLGLSNTYARVIMHEFKKEHYVEVSSADIGKWRGLEVYKINDRGRWKLNKLRGILGG